MNPQLLVSKNYTLHSREMLENLKPVLEVVDFEKMTLLPWKYFLSEFRIL